MIVSSISLNLIENLRTKFSKIILRAPLSSLEKKGISQIFTSLTDDIPTISNGASALPHVIVNIITALSLIVYIGFLDISIFLICVFCIALGSLVYLFANRWANREFKYAREHSLKIVEGFRSILFGIKELKLSNERKNHYLYKNLIPSFKAVRASSQRGFSFLYGAESFGELLAFFVIGLVIFIAPQYLSITKSTLIGVGFVLLFIIGPISVIFNTIPQLIKASIGYQRIHTLLLDLGKENESKEVEIVSSWNSIFEACKI